MKNQLKIVFSIALVSLFSIGCKKDSVTAVKGQKVGPPKFTVSSSTFKDGLDRDLHLGLKSPQVSCENAPKGTKIFLITVKDNALGSKQQTYWTSFVTAGTEIKEEYINHNSKGSSVNNFYIPEQNNGASECILMVVAMKSLKYVGSEAENILGTATATYKIVRPKIKNKITPVTQDPGAAADPVFATISHAFKVE